jgi:hypothetical protein
LNVHGGALRELGVEAGNLLFALLAPLLDGFALVLGQPGVPQALPVLLVRGRLFLDIFGGGIFVVGVLPLLEIHGRNLGLTFC